MAIRKTTTIVFITLTVFVVGFLGGVKVRENVSSAIDTPHLINPTVTSNLNKHFIINFLDLKKELTDIKNAHKGKTFIYFNYLSNAAWVGLDEKELFYAASTIKVPLAMAVLKAVEEGKISIDDSYALQSFDLDQNFGHLYQVGEDAEVTIQDLVRFMLQDSDNTAMFALIEILGRIGINRPFDDVYSEMGWEFSVLGELPDYEKINLKTLSNMFLSLYNATYVNVEHSQMILKYLAESPFNDKIVAGVPKGVAVAHKIGVAVPNDTYSDCGIVYAPNRHYLLCVGVVGMNEKKASDFMARVSKSVYDFVISH
jgi:beta-lactamase class A